MSEEKEQLALKVKLQENEIEKLNDKITSIIDHVSNADEYSKSYDLLTEYQRNLESRTNTSNEYNMSYGDVATIAKYGLEVAEELVSKDQAYIPTKRKDVEAKIILTGNSYERNDGGSTNLYSDYSIVVDLIDKVSGEIKETHDIYDFAINENMKKIAVGVGNEFNIFDEKDVSHIELSEKNTTVTVNDISYKLHVGKTFVESSKVDDMLDSSGGLQIDVHTTIQNINAHDKMIESNYSEVVRAIIKNSFDLEYDDSILNQLLEEIDRGEFSLISETTERRLNELVIENEVIDVEDFLQVANEAIVSSGSNHLPLQSINTEGEPFFYVIDKNMYPRTATLNHIVSSVEAFYEDVITIEMLPTNVWVGEEALKHTFLEVIDMNVLDKSNHDLILKYLSKNSEIKLEPFKTLPVIEKIDDTNTRPAEYENQQLAVDFDDVGYDGITEDEFEGLLFVNRHDLDIYHHSNDDGTVSLNVDTVETIYSSYQEMWETEYKQPFIDMINFNINNVLNYRAITEFPGLMEKLNQAYPDVNKAYTEEIERRQKELLTESTGLEILGSDIEWTEPEHFDIFNRFLELFKGTDHEITEIFVGIPSVNDGNGEERLLVKIGSREKDDFTISSFDKNDTTTFSEALMRKVHAHESTIDINVTQKIDHERTPIVVKEIESSRPKMKL